MERNFETVMIEQCAPVLAGLKPAGLFRYETRDCADLARRVRSWNEQLDEKGLCVRVLKGCMRTHQYLVYVLSLIHIWAPVPPSPTEKERLPMLSAVEKKSDQVYRWLLAYIDENKFSGNQRLPSENALCRKLGVSRETIRVAIDRLVKEGLVYKLKGSGTYFHREKVMTRDLNTDDALYKIGLILQGQDTSANSGLIEGVRSVLTQEQVDLHVFLTDNKFCNCLLYTSPF